jgi:hypothetical protein
MADMDHFIIRDGLAYETIDPRTLQIAGEVVCEGGLSLFVTKHLEVTNDLQVKTFRYRYHAQFTDPPLRQIFRYDNGHVYGREGHPDAFHRHTFDTSTWHEIVPPTWIGYEHWPTLREVLEELYEWWITHQDDRLIFP